MTPRKVIIDTDPGVDDILAILLAFSATPEQIEVPLITVTYGNIGLEDCLRNVLLLFHYVDQEITWRESSGRSSGFEALRSAKPVVAIGAENPLAENALTGDVTNAQAKLEGDLSSSPLSNPTETWRHLLEVAEKSGTPEQGVIATMLKPEAPLFTQSHASAHSEILQLLRDNEPNSITIIAIGPMTNLALAAAEDPETFLKVKEVVVMGGNIDYANNPAFQTPSYLPPNLSIPEPPFRLIKQPPGPIRDALNMRNQTAPVADFNTFADPVAAARVYALTSPKPHAVMPMTYTQALFQEKDGSRVSFLASYPDTLSTRLKVTLFPMDITNKHVLTRGRLEAALEPLLAAQSPLAGWVSGLLQATLDKTAAQNPAVARNEVGMQLHDPLTAWYCVDQEDSKWEISEDEDLRVETAGQWTRGMFVADRRNRKPQENSNKASSDEANGNRISRCVASPGPDLFGGLLLERIFGS